jgi:arabinogalactan oligomer/maltooligosaccharide transport system substrate-binding protein
MRLFLFLLLLVSCAPPKEDLSLSKRIVVWEQEDAAVVPYLDSVFRAFEKLPGSEGVTIERTHYHMEDLKQQFLTASIAGNPPDLLMTPSDTAGVYSVAGFIQPVDGLFDLSRYNNPVVEAIRMNGRTWGVPISNGNHLMLFYNKRLVPRAPQDTDEWFSLCAAAVKKHKLEHCMALFLGEPFWLMPWVGAYGGWPLEGRTPALDTQPMRDSMQWLLDLVYERKLAPKECDYNCVDALFKEEKVAFIINGDWAISTYKDRFKSGLGVAKIPRLSSTGRWPTPMVSGKYFMLSAKLEGEKLSLIRRLVEFYTGEENQIRQVGELMRLPALSKAAECEAVKKDPILRESMAQVLVGKPMPMATEMRAVWDAIRPMLARVVIRTATPEEAAAKMQKDAVEKIKEMDE